MTALSVARTLGKGVGEVTANQDVTTVTIARTLGIGQNEAITVGDLGVAIAVPGAPTSVVATVVDATHVSLAFTAPASDGGAGISGYTATSSVGGFTGTNVESPIIVEAAFVSATAYTFTVKATNSEGDSAASAASNSVTPNP